MEEKDLTESSVTVLIEIDGMVHLIAMEPEKKEALELMAKMCAVKAYRTRKSQNELRNS